MESSLAALIKIAQVSQELGVALSDANARGVSNGPGIARAQSLSNRILIASQEILEILNQCMIASISPDEQLEGWISANGPVICLFALNEMKRIINPPEPAGKTRFGYILPSIFNSPLSPEKIHEALKIFDNHRQYFDVLLMSRTW